jgi:hypothetical protein
MCQFLCVLVVCSIDLSGLPHLKRGKRRAIPRPFEVSTIPAPAVCARLRAKPANESSNTCSGLNQILGDSFITDDACGRRAVGETIDSLTCVNVLIGILCIRPLLVTPFLVRDSVSCHRLCLWRVVYPNKTRWVNKRPPKTEFSDSCIHVVAL